MSKTPAPNSVRNGSSNQSSDSVAWTVKHSGVDVHGLGDPSILFRRCLGLICSVQCPGSVVIHAFDAIRELRDAGVVVAGGFHSPMEKECLEFLLRGEQPVIVVLAKNLRKPRLPHGWREAIEARRLLILSPFPDSAERTTKATAQTRNEFVAMLAAAVLIPHASPGGKAEGLAQGILEQAKPLFTFDVQENATLLKWGAEDFCIARTAKVLSMADDGARIAQAGVGLPQPIPTPS